MKKEKMSNAKLVAIIVSITLHVVLFYYLGKMAIDYALPKGEVTSYEMDFNKGEQATEVAVVDSAPVPAAPPAPPEPVTPPAPKPVVAKPTPSKAQAKPAKVLPVKEVSDEPVEDMQGSVPVATEVPEDTHKELMEEPKSEPIPQEEPKEVSEEAPPVVAPVVAAAPVAEAPPANAAPEGVAPPLEVPASGSTTVQHGASEGVQSDTVLTPYGTNRPISYPTMARFRKLEGVTLVHYTVSASGEVTNVVVIESSGHSVLDSQAVDTIKNWKFKPTGRDGVYERPIRYSLKGDAKAAPSQLRRLGK